MVRGTNPFDKMKEMDGCCEEVGCSLGTGSGFRTLDRGGRTKLGTDVTFWGVFAEVVGAGGGLSCLFDCCICLELGVKIPHLVFQTNL